MSKRLSFPLFVALVMASPVFAASKKVCFGSKRAQETAGVVLTAEITKKAITIHTVKGNLDYNNVYPAYNTSVNGRDGKVYLEYKGENSDYQDVIMVDQDLLKKGTTGLLQIRARGEGFFNSVFVCRDDARRQ